MRALDATFSVLWHSIAGLCSAGLLTVIPILIYIMDAIASDDPGGPMNIVFVPLLSLALGIGTTLIVYFPFALFFQWLSRRWNIAVWLPPLMFFPLSILFFLVRGALATEPPPPIGHVGFAAVFGSFLTVGFVVYWLVLVLGQRVERFFSRDQDVV